MNIITPVTGTPKVVNAVLSAADATVYTVPALTAFVLKAMTVSNTTTTAATVFVSICPSGGTVANGRVVSGFNVPANDSVAFADYVGNMMLDVGGFVSVKSGTASALDIVFSGVEMT